MRFRFHGDIMDAKLIPTMGGGAALADFDGDGNLDLVLVQQVKSASKWRKAGRTQPLADCTRLFRNRGDGTFEDVTERSGVVACGWGVSAMWADLDNDGFPDLVIGNAGEPNLVFRNRGDGTFERMEKTGLEGGKFTIGLAALDIDGDGLPDVYIGNYLETDPDRESKAKATSFMTPDEYPGQDNQMLRNLGGWKFADVTDASGTRDPGSKTIGAVALDYDGDGKTDLYVANDQWRNTLFHNEGGGRFRDVSIETGTGYPEEGSATAFGRKTRSGMGLAVADFDGDGRPDLFVTNFANEPNTLYRNVEGATFAENEREAFGGDHDPVVPLSKWGVVGARLRQRRPGRPRGLERPDPLALLHRRLAVVQPGGQELRGGGEELRAAAVPLPQRERAGHHEVPRRLRGGRRPRPPLRRRARARRPATSTATGGKTSSSTRSARPRTSSATRRRAGTCAGNPARRRRRPEDRPRDEDHRRRAREGVLHRAVLRERLVAAAALRPRGRDLRARDRAVAGRHDGRSRRGCGGRVSAPEGRCARPAAGDASRRLERRDRDVFAARGGLGRGDADRVRASGVPRGSRASSRTPRGDAAAARSRDRARSRRGARDSRRRPTSAPST